MKSLSVASAVILIGCFGPLPVSRDEVTDTRPGARVELERTAAPLADTGLRISPPSAPATPTHDARVVLEERVRADYLAGTPQLAIDGQGRPHVTATMWQAGAYWVGHWTRDETRGWQASPKAERGDVRGFVDIEPSGRPMLYSWNELASTTEVRDLTAPDNVLQRFQYLEVYQVLRDGASTLGFLGTFGGNLYFAQRGPPDWQRDYFARRDPSTRPGGVVTTGGRVAVLESRWLSYFGGASEALTPAMDRAPAPMGPAKASDGALWILRSKKHEHDWGNTLSLQRRSTYEWEAPRELVADASPPGVERCPSELGRECRFELDGHTAAALVVHGDRPLPIVVRTTHVALYQRECLQRDPDYMGCAMPPCIDEGGPRGPWIQSPGRGDTLRTALLVDGHEVVLREPLRQSGPLAASMDRAGRIHVAFREAMPGQPNVFDLRYVVIEPATSAPASTQGR